MANLDISSFLLEVSPDFPCGENLEYDPDYLEMLKLSKGKPERQVGKSVIPAEEPDWQAVKKLALSLLDRTRDIDVAVQLTRAAANTDGFEGVRQGLALTHGLMRRFWDSVYPLQDPDDKYPIERLNVLGVLNDFQGFLSTVRRIPLTESQNFKISLRDVDIATGKLSISDNEETPVSEAQVKAAFMDCSAESLTRMQHMVEAALGEVEGILKITGDRCGEMHAPDLSGLMALLRNTIKVMRGYAPQSVREGVDEQPLSTEGVGSETRIKRSNAAAGEEVQNSMKDLNSITSREDVVQAIEKICGYYDLNEPASPVPLLLKRAKRMVDMDFIEVLKELAPEGLNQAEIVCAPSSE